MEELKVKDLLLKSGQSEIEMIDVAGDIGISIDDTRNRAFIYLDLDKAAQLRDWLNEFLGDGE